MPMTNRRRCALCSFARGVTEPVPQGKARIHDRGGMKCQRVLREKGRPPDRLENISTNSHRPHFSALGAIAIWTYFFSMSKVTEPSNQDTKAQFLGCLYVQSIVLQLSRGYHVLTFLLIYLIPGHNLNFF